MVNIQTPYLAWLVCSHYVLTTTSSCLRTLCPVVTTIRLDPKIVILSSCPKSFRDPLNKGICNILTKILNSNCIRTFNFSSNFDCSSNIAISLSTTCTLHYEQWYELSHLNMVQVSATVNALTSYTITTSSWRLIFPKHVLFTTQVKSQEVHVHIITVTPKIGVQRH